MSIKTEDFCSVKRKHFDAIFKEYFRTEDITSHIKYDKDKLYSNYEVIKIHLHEPDNIDNFLYSIFEHIITFSWEKYNEYTKENLKYEESIDYLKKYFEDYPNELENITKEDLDNPKIRWKISWLKEIWEIILFFLIEWLLNAPIAISKVRTKTSSKMPVYWADWIHLSSDFSELFFWEAKLNNKFENSKIQSRDSIEWFSSDKDLVKFELKVITSQLNNIPNEKNEVINNLINPYYNREKVITELPYSITCLLWYEDEDFKLFIDTKNEALYKDKLIKKIKSLLSYYKIKETKLENKKIIFFLFPFLDMLEFLKKYSKKLSDKKNLEIINSN